MLINVVYTNLFTGSADRLQQYNIQIEHTPEFSKTTVTGYRATFYPVFVNLIDNAIYWLKDRTIPRIIKLDTDKNGSFIISDNGPGVKDRDRASIFDSGFSRKPGGRGLGLQISRDVLRKAGYDLILSDSTENKGAVFIIINQSNKI